MKGHVRVFPIACALLFIFAGHALSDIVYFKDGGQVEGIITEEAEDYIVVDLGFGTMSVRRDEIDYIEEATQRDIERLEKERFAYEVDRGAWAPPGYENIRMVYNEAKKDRGALREARRKSEALKAGVSQKEQRLSELFKLLDEKGKELKGIDPEKDLKRYNAVVTEINSINADLNKEDSAAKNLYEERKKLNKKLAGLADSYRANFQLFKNGLNEKQDAAEEDEITDDELYFIEEIGVKIGEMEGDFKKEVALYTQEGDHIIVDVLLEESVLARLMVDTGASIVLISSDVAHRLGIKYDDILARIDISMADGRTQEAKPIILKSVKVGDTEVKNVQAAILEKDVIGGVDGLLGMSFLSHFVIQVDSTANELILERIL